MFGLRKKGPTRPFAHAHDCKIVKADPGVKLPWSEVEKWALAGSLRVRVRGRFRGARRRPVRLDPLDAKTSRHAGGCEFALETDPAVLRLVLKIYEGAAAGYSWVQCTTCDTAWQIPHYAA